MVVTVTFCPESAFDAYTFPEPNWRVAPSPVSVLIPTRPEVPKMTEVFRVCVFARGLRMVPKRAFDAKTLPRTRMVAPPPVLVLIPTFPAIVKMLAVSTLVVTELAVGDHDIWPFMIIWFT
jgi:hypothetical protein